MQKSTYITNRIKELSEPEYKSFHSKLMPTVDENKILGVRIPLLRKLAKEIYGTKSANDFLKELPHEFYEENNLHAFVLEQIKDFDMAIEETERFLPYIDNWATCDSFNPKIFRKYPDELLIKIFEWLKSDKVYTVRFAIKLLMNYFLDERFDKSYLAAVADLKSEEYYVQMMQAWYFATALAKQYSSALEYVQKGRLSEFVRKKAIQKACESFRIDVSTKEYLKGLV